MMILTPAPNGVPFTTKIMAKVLMDMKKMFEWDFARQVDESQALTDTNAWMACHFEAQFLFSMRILDEDTDVANDGQNNYERIRVAKAQRNLYNGLKLQMQVEFNSTYMNLSHLCLYGFLNS